jgi:hypothetical protein
MILLLRCRLPLFLLHLRLTSTSILLLVLVKQFFLVRLFLGDSIISDVFIDCIAVCIFSLNYILCSILCGLSGCSNRSTSLSRGLEIIVIVLFLGRSAGDYDYIITNTNIAMWQGICSCALKTPLEPQISSVLVLTQRRGGRVIDLPILCAGRDRV